MHRRKSGNWVQVSVLLSAKESLSKKMEEMRIKLAITDTKILHLKMQNKKLSSKGPGATKELATENMNLHTKVVKFTTEVQGLYAEVKDLTKQISNAHAAESSRMEFLLNFFSSKSLST